jgi:hypothetical protein
MPLGRSAGRSPRRSHRILDLQPRSCSWRSISPRTSLGGSSSPLPSSACLARASARSIRWFCTRFSRSCGPGDEVQPSLLGSARPGQQFPGDCLRLLADLDPDSINHAPGRSPATGAALAPPAPCRAAPTPRGSGISAGQLLPILCVSRVAGCGNRYLPRSSPFTQRVPGPRPLQPEPRPAQRSGPAAQRRSPAPTAVSSRADIDDLLVVGHPGAVGTARGTVVRDRPWPPGTAHAARHGPRRVHRRHRRD